LSRSSRRWLLPDAMRSAVVVIDTGCLGLAVLGSVDGQPSIARLTGLGVAAGTATLLTLVPRRRQAPRARTVAAVVAANQPPHNKILGRCAMVLRLNDVDGSPRQFLHIDPFTPTAAWPSEGSRVMVEVARGRKKRVAVLWQYGVGYPNPTDGSIDSSGVLVVPGLADADLLALPRLARVDPVPTAEPSHVARWYLVPTEKFRGEWRRHWIRWIKEAVVGLGLALVILSGYRLEVRDVVVDLGAIQSPDLVSQGFWGAWVVWRGLTWLSTRLVLTSKRVMLIKGIVFRRVASVPLTKATDILHTKSLLGTLFGYGSFRFSSVPVLRPLWRVGDLPRPRDLYQQIVAETLDPEPREAAQLPAQLDASLDDLLAAPAA
jgi:PH (Pleckstrin Homology) domain-containing protein